jgi:hypothetical protein
MVSSGRSDDQQEESQTMRRLSAMCGALLLGALITPAQKDLTLQVEIHYTGSGTVDKSHKIFVLLWDSPGFLDNSVGPVDVRAATSKNATVTFYVQKVPAYVSTAYDPTGVWNAQDVDAGTPPSGSSLGMYTKAPPKPEPIKSTPEKVARVTISFDDSNKAK